MVQAHCGGDNPFDTKAILAEFPLPDRAWYQGGYCGIASWLDDNENEKVAVYHGQSAASVAGRIGYHEIKRLDSDSRHTQHVTRIFREAKERDFRATHLHEGETPVAVITMCEVFFMVRFGHVQNGERGEYTNKIRYWINKVRGNLNPPEEWVTVNYKIPTKETAQQVRRVELNGSRKWRVAQAVDAPGIKCWLCGDSKNLAISNGSDVRLLAQSGLIWCQACLHHYSTHKSWKLYLIPSIAACLNCGSQDGTTLAAMNGATTWQTSFRCHPCRKYFQAPVTRQGVGDPRERPETSWLPHLRRPFRCQPYSEVEGQGTTFRPMKISTQKHMICLSCVPIEQTIRSYHARSYSPWGDGQGCTITASYPLEVSSAKGARTQKKLKSLPNL